MGGNCCRFGYVATPSSVFLPLQTMNVENILTRYKHECHSCFSFTRETLDLLLMQTNAAALFTAFDTGSNDLIDAFEVLSALILLAKSHSTREKLQFLYSLYNFTNTNTLSYDELTLMFRTVALASSKVDPVNVTWNQDEMDDSFFEKHIVDLIFTSAQKDPSSELSLPEVLSFLLDKDSMTSYFIEFWQRLNNSSTKRSLKDTPKFPASLQSIRKEDQRSLFDPLLSGCITWKSYSESDVVFGTVPPVAGKIVTNSSNQHLYCNPILASVLNMVSTTKWSDHILSSIFTPDKRSVRLYTLGAWNTTVEVSLLFPFVQEVSSYGVYSKSDVYELWPKIIEKALASYFGSYEALVEKLSIPDSIPSLLYMLCGSIAYCQTLAEFPKDASTLKTMMNQGMVGIYNSRSDTLVSVLVKVVENKFEAADPILDSSTSKSLSWNELQSKFTNVLYCPILSRSSGWNHSDRVAFYNNSSTQFALFVHQESTFCWSVENTTYGESIHFRIVTYNFGDDIHNAISIKKSQLKASSSYSECYESQSSINGLENIMSVAIIPSVRLKPGKYAIIVESSVNTTNTEKLILNGWTNASTKALEASDHSDIYELVEMSSVNKAATAAAVAQIPPEPLLPFKKRPSFSNKMNVQRMAFMYHLVADLSRQVEELKIRKEDLLIRLSILL